jgi:preprotein translocase subunit SecA
MVEQVIAGTVETWCPADIFPEEWDREGMLTALAEIYPVTKRLEDVADLQDVPELQGILIEDALAAYERREAELGVEVMRQLERVVLLNISDAKWREHLYEMDYLQEGIHLRAYAQKDPLTEYQREAYEMFEELTDSIRSDFVKYIYRVEVVRQPAPQAAPARVQDNRSEVEAPTAAANGGGASDGNGGLAIGARAAGNPQQAVSDKVPRNAPCPCGSGKKYKKCHGATAAV